MSGMTTVALKGLWANKSRFTLSGLAVIISVAFLTAMLLLTDALAGSASEDLAVANDGIDAVVLGEELGLGDGPPGAEEVFRAEIEPTTVDALLAVGGVDEAIGIRSSNVQLLDEHGSLLDTGSQATIGETWVAHDDLSAFVLVAGTAPIDGVVIDRLTADETGLSVGDPVQVLTDVRIAAVTVDGIATYGPADSAYETATILFADDTDLFSTDGFTRVVVSTELDPAALAEAAGVDVVQSGADYVADLRNVIDTQTTFQTTFFLAFAIIALIAGTTIIYNTFVIAVAQRTRELALLRSIGASRRQVLAAVMGEAAVIGVLASVLGALVGIGSAFGLLAFFEFLGLPVITGTLPVQTSSLVIGAGVGLVVTLVSAFVPARKAANTPPIAALRDAAVDPSGVSRARNGVAAVLLVGGVAAAAGGAIGESWEIAVGGVFAGFVGVIVGGPLLAGAISTLAGTPLEWMNGTVGRLAGTNAARNPRRSASTALALTLGVTLMAFFTVIASSMSGTAAADTEAALSADQVVMPFATFGGPDDITYLPPTVADSIEPTDGVDVVVPVASTSAIVDGGLTLTAGADIAAFERVYELEVSSGSLDDVSGTTVAVHADAVADAAVGGSLTLDFPQSGPVDVTIGAVFENSLPGQFPAEFLFDDDAFAGAAPGAGDQMIFVATDGSDTAVAALADAVDAAGGAELLTAGEYADSLGSAIDAFRNFVYAMLGAAVLIAVVGIANTTVMAIGERTKEIGMLRSIGMTAEQVRKMVRNEALVLSIQGSVVGLVLGVGGVYATFAAIGGDDLTLVLPVTSLGVIGVGAAISGVLAAAWPAWRASRMDPLDAIAS